MSLVPIRGPLPRLVKQLETGAGTGGDDCGFASLVTVIQYASQGKVGPKSSHEWKEWIRLVRELADRPTGDCRFRAHALPVLRHEHLADRFRAKGLKPIPAALLSGASFHTMKEHLRQDRAILLSINYGEHREAGGLMASDQFSRGHAVVLVGVPTPTDEGSLEVNEGDPLFDGRRGLPKGWQRVPLFPFRRSAGLFGTNPWGIGKVEAIAIGRSARRRPRPAPVPVVVDPPPIVTDPTVPPQSLADARQTIKALRRQNDQLRATLEGITTDAERLALMARKANTDEH